jgi:methionine sulfoxide reductase heme-binding subunit
MLKLIDTKAAPLLIGLALGLAAVALGWWAGATPAEEAKLAARWTARIALPMFLVAYLASSLLRLWSGDLTKALVRRRRQWGLGFALTHTIHLAALAYNVLNYDPRSLPSLFPGGLAYVMVYIMAMTSNNTSMKALGKNWKRLHIFGIDYIWFIFTASYVTRIFKPEMMATGLLFTPVMFAALGLRLYARRGQQSRVATA